MGAASLVCIFAFYNPARFYEDFCRYYLMGKLATGPNRLQFYALPVQAQALIDFWGGAKFPHSLALNTPPVVIPFVSLLSFLELRWAYLIWCAVNVGLLLIGIALIMQTRSWTIHKLFAVILVFAGILASVPGSNDVAEGQTAGIICGLVGIFFWSFQQKRHIICGITLGLIAFKFQYLPFILVPVIVGRRWKTLLAMAVFELLLLSTTAIAIGVPNLLAYPAFVLKIESDPNYSGLIDPRSMINLKGLIDSFSAALGLKLGYALLALALVVLAKIWIDAKDRPEAFPWAVSLTVLIALLCSPHTHDYDSILLVIPFLYACPHLLLTESFEARPLSLKLWNIILVAMPLLTWGLRFIDMNPFHLKYLSQILINSSLLLLAWINCDNNVIVSPETTATRTT